MFFPALSDDLNNLSPNKSRIVINMVIKALNYIKFSKKHLFELFIIEYSRRSTISFQISEGSSLNNFFAVDRWSNCNVSATKDFFKMLKCLFLLLICLNRSL